MMFLKMYASAGVPEREDSLPRGNQTFNHASHAKSLHGTREISGFVFQTQRGSRRNF